MFESLSEKFSSAFATLRSRGKITPADIDSICVEIRQALLDGDVALDVVDSFLAQVRNESLIALPGLQAGSNQAQAIYDIINKALIEILGGQERRIRMAKKPPTVIMLAGLQGAGKTTLAGKLAKYFL
ncbi:MAG: signal recognition particle protein, partial [Actinobacteria bacterium]|nr:signal recognition particle protein [Actinomycetota bacterium]